MNASVNYVCISYDNGLSPIQHQAIILTSAVLLPIWPIETNFRETNFSEISIKMQKFSFMKMHLKITSAKGSYFVQVNYSLLPAIGHSGLIIVVWINFHLNMKK